MTDTPFPLGRSVNHDPRSRAFPYKADATQYRSVRHERKIPVFDQGYLGSCTGNAALGCLGYEPFLSTVLDKVTFDQASAVEVYSAATEIDPFPGTYKPTDTGSDGLSVAKVLHKRELISGYQHAFSFEAALTALSNGPVITGTNWYSSMFYPDSEGIVRINTGSTAQGGHEYILDEIDAERGLIGATNSWGGGWGRGGRFYISFETFSRLLREYGDVTVFVPNTAPAPTPEPQPTPALNLDQQLWDRIGYWARPRPKRPSFITNHRARAYVRQWASEKGLK